MSLRAQPLYPFKSINQIARSVCVCICHPDQVNLDRSRGERTSEVYCLLFADLTWTEERVGMLRTKASEKYKKIVISNELVLGKGSTKQKLLSPLSPAYFCGPMRSLSELFIH